MFVLVRSNVDDDDDEEDFDDANECTCNVLEINNNR